MKFGRYTVKRQLGRGGMGVVYLAHDTELERDVAIKTLPGVNESNPERLRRFEREAKILAAITHPNIATIYSIEKVQSGRRESESVEFSTSSSSAISESSSTSSGEHAPPGMRFIVMEFVDGETLGSVLKTRTLSPQEILELMLQVAKAVTAAHAKGIIHRDLKPSNVMVTSDMTVKVLDFGLARREASNASDPDVTHTAQTMPGKVLGTVGYMSPEQARAKPVDHRTDIWSFGCMLFQALTGEPAFHGETSTDVIASTLHHQPNWEKLPLNTPRKLRELLERMLAKNVDDRLEEMMQAIAVLNESMCRWTDDDGVTDAAQFGRFEVVGEHYSGPRTTIWEVKPIDEHAPRDEHPKRYAAKVIEPSTIMHSSSGVSDADPVRQILDPFRAAAETQKTLADDIESHHWAPIHDAGGFRGGAFYVTDFFEYTAQDLLAAAGRSRSAELYALIYGAVRGLRELDRRSQRAHGNLKPTNILLIADEKNPHTPWRVMLSDPASDAELRASAKRSEDDLNVLGNLLYRLVEGTEWRQRIGVKPPLNNAWKQLDRHGEQWHALCCDLLDLNPPMLPELEQRLEELDPSRGGLPLKPLLVMCSVLLLVVVAWAGQEQIRSFGLGVAGLFDRNGAEQVVIDPNEDSRGDVDDPTPPGQINPPPPEHDDPDEPEPPSPPPSDRMLNQLAWFDAFSRGWLQSEDPAFGALNVPGRITPRMQQLSDELGGVAEDELSTEQLARFAVEVETLHNDLADGLRELRSGSELPWPSANAELNRAFDRLETIHARSPTAESGRALAQQLASVAPLLEIREAAMSQWQQLQPELDRITQWAATVDDPIAGKVAETITLNLDHAALEELPDRLADGHAWIDAVDDVIGRWDEIDHAHLWDSDLYEPIRRDEPLGRSAFRTWHEGVMSGAYDLLDQQLGPRMMEKFVASIARPLQSLDERKADWQRHQCAGREIDAPPPDADDVEQLLRELKAIEWDRTRRAREAIEQQQTLIGQRLDQKAEQWQQALQACIGECEEAVTANRRMAEREIQELPQPIREGVEDVLLRDVERLGADAAVPCHERLEEASQLRAFAVMLGRESALPRIAPPERAPRGVDEDGFIAAIEQAWGEHMRRAVDALDALDWSDDVTDQGHSFWQAHHHEREAFEAWHARAIDLMGDFADLERALGIAMAWSDVADSFEQWQHGDDRDVLDDLAERFPAVQTITAELSLLQDLDGRTVHQRAAGQALTESIGDESRSRAYRWTAWRKLDDATGQRDFLHWEEGSKPHLSTMIEAIEQIDRDRAETLREEMNRRRSDRWLKHAEHARDANWLSDAFDRMDEFNIQPARLPDRLRFNYEMRRLQQMARRYAPRADDEAARREAVRRQAGEARQALDRLDDPAATARWRDTLEHLRTFEMVDREPNWDEAGPARVGWRRNPGEEGAEVMRFRPPRNWIDAHGELLRRYLGEDYADFTLAFRRVSLDDNPDGPATYVSTSEVSAGLFLAVVSVLDMHSLMNDHLMDNDDPRGASLWAWHGSRLALKNLHWLRDQGSVESWSRNNEWDFSLPAPGPEFPMHNVSPAAAMGLAQLLGCRLPIESETRAALQTAIQRRGQVEANVFGAEVQELIEIVTDYNRGSADRAGEVMGRTSRETLYRTRDEPANAAANAVLEGQVDWIERAWFSPVDMGADQMQHIIGNVAEYVFSDDIDPEEVHALPDARTRPEAFVSSLRELAVPDGGDPEVRVRIFGGSIFSEPDRHAILRTLPYHNRPRANHSSDVYRQSYPDVGFRLVFESPQRRSGREEFQQLLAEVSAAADVFVLARR